MPTPNYSYEKRQRELAKKRKNEEKRQRKLHRADGSPIEGEGTETADGSPAAAVAESADPGAEPPRA